MFWFYKYYFTSTDWWRERNCVWNMVPRIWTKTFTSSNPLQVRSCNFSKYIKKFSKINMCGYSYLTLTYFWRGQKSQPLTYFSLLKNSGPITFDLLISVPLNIFSHLSVSVAWSSISRPAYLRLFQCKFHNAKENQLWL